MFNKEDYEILIDGFERYGTEKAKLQPSSLARYQVILDDYFKTNVINKVSKEDYDDMFDSNRLRLLKRKSNNVRPSLLHFLDFLKYEGFIKEEYLYFKLQDNIKSIFVSQETDKVSSVSFLTPNEVRYIFSGNVTCRNDYEEKLLNVICSLSFFNMLKQEDLSNLSLEDLDLSNKRIKNIRKLDSNSELLDWLSLNNTTLYHLENYLSVREDQLENGSLLVLDNAPLDNNKFNHLLRTFEFASNREHVGNKSIFTGLLIRSMMLFILKSTNGLGLYQILLEQEKNTYFEDAFNEYLTIHRNLNDSDISKNFDIEEILPSIKNTPLVIGAYSESKDITEVDLKGFDSFNERNFKMTSITIQRLVRDSEISKKLKELYNFECQLCGYQLRKSNGNFISEGHHIQPYNQLHRGDDNSQNIIILCPNCHAQFDDLYYAIHPETQEIWCIFEEDDQYHKSKLKMKDGHVLNKRYTEYTWELFNNKKEVLRLIQSKEKKNDKFTENPV